MKIEDLKFNNEYHVVTYNLVLLHDSIPITVTANGCTDLSTYIDDDYDYVDVMRAIDKLNKDFEMVLYEQENC